MDLTCRECTPHQHSKKCFKGSSLACDLTSSVLGGPDIELCPKHAEADDLRRQLEEARQLLEDVINIFPQRQAMLPTIRKIKDALGRRR